MVSLMYCIVSILFQSLSGLASVCPFRYSCFSCLPFDSFPSKSLPDPDVRAREVVTEGEGVAPGVLEHHRPHGHPHILGRHGSASPGAAVHELRPSHLLCQHHLLVHPAARHLWSQQVPGTLRDDDWQNGEMSLDESLIFLGSYSVFFLYIWLFGLELEWCVFLGVIVDSDIRE